jgi:hypothetical protein
MAKGLHRQCQLLYDEPEKAIAKSIEDRAINTKNT